jgi:YVTN family beta-propeller protein
VALVVAIGLAAVGVVVATRGSDNEVDVAGAAATSSTSSTAPTTTTLPPTTTTTLPPGPPAAEATLGDLGDATRITGDISPKSVVASGHGVVFAQNMMYTHSVTAYAADGTLLATIPDAVDLSAFGVAGHPGVSQGAPVEAAFTHDGRFAYVSNYSMYGNGWGAEGTDSCTPDDGYDDSFVYRIDTTTMAIDQVIAVGAVPKYVAVTPDDRTVLVTNWCTFDLSIIDVATATETARVPLGRYPRGIVVSPDSATGWIGVMGDDRVVAVDLTSPSHPVRSLGSFGDGPRHVLLSPDGSALFVSHNRSGTVVRIDTATGAETARVSTGAQPRSMAISSDGTAIYVANYESSTLTKLRASDLTVLDEVGTDHHPIGVAYEPTTRTVWVACYGGSILIYPDQ